MEIASTIKSIAFLGDHLPRQCGIATFTSDICEAVAAQFPQCQCVVGAVNDRPEGYDYPAQVRFEIDEKELDSYRRAADFLNINNVEVVSVQHEFGIYGGPAGSHLLAFLRDVHMPVVTTLHTVLQEPNPEQTGGDEATRYTLQSVHCDGRPRQTFPRGNLWHRERKDRRDPAWHPGHPFHRSNFNKDQFGVEGKTVLLTFGLLSPNKGIEYVIEALPEILAQHPNVVYIILGATHPNLLAREGESYRLKLERLAEDRGVTSNVIFYNRFVDDRGIERIYRRGRHLHHALSERIPDYFRHPGIQFRRRESSHFHTLLACEGVAGERSRHPGAVRQSGSNSKRGEPLSFRSGPDDGHAQTRLETGTRDDLVGGRPAPHGKLRTRASKLECFSKKSVRSSNPGQSPLSVAAAQARSPASNDR